ncbi:hypothetical protein G6F38_011741 [Rhizopus arrhizus]|nr:hypothetical protein G6F38_011741 [Rhizopus arrhizus]
MLSVTISFQLFDKGPGAWKANPYLARSKRFQEIFNDHLEKLHVQLSSSTHLSPQKQWDWLKDRIKSFIRGYQIEKNNWRTKQLKKLQRKRNRILRQYKNYNVLSAVLPQIEQQIGCLQDAIAEIECLRAGKFWRENNEKSPGFLKRMIKTRETQRCIPVLQHPITSNICYDQDSKREAVETFCSTLYSPDTIEHSALQRLLSNIPDSIKLSEDQRDNITAPIIVEDII